MVEEKDRNIFKNSGFTKKDIIINEMDINKLAERLNFFMEKYDPSFGDEGSINWDELDERQKDFYRLIVRRIAVDFYDCFFRAPTTA